MKVPYCLTYLPRIGTTLLLLFFGEIAFGQHVFDYSLPGFYETYPEISSIGSTPDKGYYYTGNSLTFPNIESTFFNLRDKLDQHRFFVRKSADPNPHPFFGAHLYQKLNVLPRTDSSFWVAGNIQINGVFNSASPRSPFVEYYDTRVLGNGYHILFNSGANDRFESIHLMTRHPSGGFSLVGNVLPDSNLLGRGVFFSRIGPAPNHSVLWTRYYSHPEGTFYRDAAAFDDGGMAIACSLDSTGSYLLATDSLGFKKWSHRLRNLTLLAVEVG